MYLQVVDVMGGVVEAAELYRYLFNLHGRIWFVRSQENPNFLDVQSKYYVLTLGCSLSTSCALEHVPRKF
jgi:hypothetical protein